MNRGKKIEMLKSLAPLITSVTATSDMGFEFSAVVPNGVIYSIPGMLLDYSSGEWPPNSWQEKTKVEFEELFRSFVMDETWDVTPWDQLNDEDVEEWLDIAVNVKND